MSVTSSGQELSTNITSEQHSSSWSNEMLSEDRIHDLLTDLIPDQETRAGRNMGLHVVDGNDPHSDIGRYIEWKVFEQRFGNGLETMREEYEPYDKTSVFLIVLDYEKEKPAAVLRLILPTNETEMKSIKDLLNPDTEVNHWYNAKDTEASLLQEIGATDSNNTVDIGTMAVLPAYASAHARDGVSAALYSSCVRWSLENDYNYWVTIVDERILNLMQAWGEPFLEFKDKGFEPYLDSEASRPVHLELYSGLEKVKAFDSKIYDLYTKGSGLENVFVLPEFVLPESL